MSPIQASLLPRTRPTRKAPPLPLSLGALQRALYRLEEELGLMAVRIVIARLDHPALCALAREGSPDNDPRLVDPRYVLLPGMRGPRVSRLQQALWQLGYNTPDTGVYDERTAKTYALWRAKQQFPPKDAGDV